MQLSPRISNQNMNHCSPARLGSSTTAQLGSSSLARLGLPPQPWPHAIMDLSLVMLPRAPPTPVPPLARAVVLPPSVRPPLQKQLASRSPAPRAPKPRMVPPPHGERLHHLARRGHHPRDSWRRLLRPNCSGRLCQWSSNISTHLALRPDPGPAHAPTGSPGPAPRMVSSTPILPTTLHVGRCRRHPSHQWHPRRLGRLCRWSPIVPAHRARRSVPRVNNGSARAQR
jgi:hypothetical protein